MVRGIYLVGFSGSGKSTIAKLIAKKLQWPACDLDELIVERSNLTIPVIFQREGEPGFRLREAEALRAVSSSGAFVVATGGGTVVRPENRAFMATKGWVVCLDAQPQTIHARIQRQLKKSEQGAIRPMLDAANALDQIRALKHTRQSAYGLADWTVHTDRLTEEQVVNEVIRAVEILENSNVLLEAEDAAGSSLRQSLNPEMPAPIVVAAGPWPYQVVVGWDNLNLLGEQVRRVLPQARRVAILTDADTWERLEERVRHSLQAADFEVHVRTVATGEAIKSLEEVSAIHDWLLGLPLRRDDIFLTLGNSAIDDLGGFAASTYMRGVALVKVPTSLEGMVDSAIGGKSALNHPRARNLIGTFYQPRLVWADASLLQYEPQREIRAEFAEVVKYAMLESSLLRDLVAGTSLFDELKQNLDRLKGLEKGILLKVIARCIALKSQVVAGDERDVGQYRILLNYGHTIGHALETATNYEIAHGDAVAIGMAIEASLSVRLGLATADVEACQRELLTQFGLPTKLPKVLLDHLLSLIYSDKKVLGGAPRWILPVAPGRAVVSNSVAEPDLIAVLKEHSL